MDYLFESNRLANEALKNYDIAFIHLSYEPYKYANVAKYMQAAREAFDKSEEMYELWRRENNEKSEQV